MIQINKVRNKNETLQLMPHKYKKTWDYYKKIICLKLNNLEVMDKFLETCNLLIWNYEDTENLNRSITSKEMELVIKNCPTKKSSEPDIKQLSN